MIAARGITQRILGTTPESPPLNHSPAPPTMTGWIGIGAWMLYLGALLAGCVLLTAWTLLPFFPDTGTGRLVAVICGTLGGVTLFAVLGGLSTLALCWVLNALDALSARRHADRLVQDTQSSVIVKLDAVTDFDAVLTDIYRQAGPPPDKTED